MTIIFTEGFDKSTTLLDTWSAGTSVISNVGRTGTGGLTQTGTATTKQVAAANEHATFIWGVAINRGSSTGTFEMRFLSDSLATQHVTVQVTSTGEIKVFRGSTAGTQLGSTVSAGTVPAGTWVYLEAKVTLSDTVGVVTVRVNGAQVFTISSADTKNGGTKTVLDGIGMAIANVNALVDDIVLMNGAGSTNNDFIGDIKIETLYPTGAGNTTGLTPSTGSNWSNVDETPRNTSDYNGSATDNLYDTYQMGNLATLTGTVYAINIFAYTAKSDAGAAGGAIMLRSGGTDYEKTDVALGTGFAYQNEIIETDPATSVQWTITNVNAMEAGFKKKAS